MMREMFQEKLRTLGRSYKTAAQKENLRRKGAGESVEEKRECIGHYVDEISGNNK